MNILSINFSHDASICYLKDGEIKVYLKEERFSKIKKDFFPVKCITKFSQEFENEKIDYVVINNVDYSIKDDIYFKYITKSLNVGKIINFEGSHHLSHASLAFYNSGFDECLSIVVDGRGSTVRNYMSECESVYLFSYDNHKPLLKNYFRAPYWRYEADDVSLKQNEFCNGILGGIVNFYTTSTLLFGQSPHENGKAMGLSSYGKSIDGFPKIFKDTSDVTENLFELFYHKEHNVLMPVYREYQSKITDKITTDNYQLYADYAYEVQTQTQEAVGDLIEISVENTGIKKVCISGGYGMNVVANHYYLQRFPDVEFYFEPISDDSGVSIGSAKYIHHSLTKDKTKRPLTTTSFHGTSYDISKYKGVNATVDKISDLLFNNNSVAVYTGLSESGQRALGNRSILFNPLNPDAKDIVNKIKNREWYRPFAAIVLEEDANIYFDMGAVKSSPFMTICFHVRSEYVNIIPGVTHVDNTCRIQTVSETDGYIYELLCKFKELTGHGILLNTSFNLAGEPLVETPDDAFNTLNNSCLNYLWFEETKQLFS